MEEPQKEPFLVRLKYWITLTLGLVACLSSFSFFFFIPFVLDPCISTLVADFDPDPVVCKTVHLEHRFGMKNCSWSSCKLGCTIDQFACDIIYVNYLITKFEDFEGTEFYEDDDDIWIVKGVPVFVNIKACGYPPKVNCTIFGDTYGPLGSVFPCYYSRATPSLVITDYSYTEAVHPLIMALILPNLITGVSLGVLSYWWYPNCQKDSGNQYQLPPDQQSNHDPDDEDKEKEEKGSQAGADDEGGGKEDENPENVTREVRIDLLAGDTSKQDSKEALEPEKTV